jgi:hypothetical protein
MNTTISGFWCKKQLSHPLKPILKQWIRINKYIAENGNNIGLWGDTERSSISILAGAIWNSGNIAFEEYSNEKRDIFKTGRLKRQIYKGRVDIYFTADTYEFIGEAKICWVGATKSIDNKICNKIDNCLNKTKYDVKKIHPHYKRRLSIVFVNPYFKINKAKDINDKIRKWITLLENVNCHAAAWVFPAVARNLKYKQDYFPGTAIVIKEYKRRT